MRRIVPAAMAAIFLFAGRASASEADVPAFALVVVSAAVASDRCPAVAQDFVRQSRLWAEIEAGGGDPKLLPEALARKGESVHEAFEKAGQAKWCASAWSLLGPGGLGVIRRKGRSSS